jgi:hypothetical protein
MVSDPKLQCYGPEVVKQMLVQDHNMMIDELINLNALRFMYWKKYADEVTVPICLLLMSMIGYGMGTRSMRKSSWGASRKERELKEVLLLAVHIRWSSDRAAKDGIRGILGGEVRSAPG